MRRRNFIRNTGFASAALLSGTAGMLSCNSKKSAQSNKQMSLRFAPYNLQLKHVFTLANSSRSTTPVVLTAIDYDGHTGYGEASMPPYLGETQESAASFLAKVDLSRFSNPFLLEDILQEVDAIAVGNHAAKASVDIALHDLIGKLTGRPWYQLWGLNPDATPLTSFTIGIDEPEVVRKKVKEAAPYKILKVKMGRDNDKQMIETIRSVTDVPLCVDVNQGWKDRQQALEMIYWLKEKGIVFVEQPMSKDAIDDLAWLQAHTPLPIFADEALQRLADVEATKGLYNGINIKLMKCTGMREAYKMANLARALDMSVMLGCMTETSCAVSAAAQLSPLCEFADLDGNLLISNDPYSGIQIIDGKVSLTADPGIGIEVIQEII